MAMTERERLEDKITHLCNLARRYSVHDPKYLRYHEQIDESLELWQMEVEMEADGLVIEPPPAPS